MVVITSEYCFLCCNNRNGLFVCLFGVFFLLYLKISFTRMFLQYLSQFFILLSNLAKENQSASNR